MATLFVAAPLFIDNSATPDTQFLKPKKHHADAGERNGKSDWSERDSLVPASPDELADTQRGNK